MTDPALVILPTNHLGPAHDALLTPNAFGRRAPPSTRLTWMICQGRNEAMSDKLPNKVIAGLEEAVRHAQGENTGARVKTYRVDNGAAAVAKDDLIERAPKWVARQIRRSERPWVVFKENGPHGDEIVCAGIRDKATAVQIAEAATALATRDARIAELSEHLAQAVAYADIVAENEGMPPGGQAKRLTVTTLGPNDIRGAVFDVKAARLALKSEAR